MLGIVLGESMEHRRLFEQAAAGLEDAQCEAQVPEPIYRVQSGEMPPKQTSAMRSSFSRKA